MIEHLGHEQVARIFIAFMQALMGVLQLASPGCFSGTSMYFRGARASLTPQQRDRLERVLDARSGVEGNTYAATRWSGIFAIALAPLVLIPAVPYVLPYAASCLVLAFATLVAYVQLRRATERRVAPLLRRTPLSAFSPMALAAVAVCLAGALAFATLPQFRLAAIAIVLASLALCAIAWRVAVAPAILVGDDPQLEYAVDEHVRFCRTTGLIALACAPAAAFVFIAGASLRDGGPFFTAVTLAVGAAFVVAMVVSQGPLRKRLRLA